MMCRPEKNEARQAASAVGRKSRMGESRMSRLAGLRQLPHRFPPVRAVLLLAAVMIVATVVATAVLLAELRQENVRRARSEIVTLTRVLAEQTTRTFEGVSLTLNGIKERLSDEVGLHLDLDSDLVRFLLLARSAGLPQVKSIFVVDAHGRGVNSSRPDFIPRLDVTARSFYRSVADEGADTLFISAPEIARVDGQWTFYVSTRLAYPDGRFRGVLVAAINLEYFEALYESVRLDSVTCIQLLDLDGALMAGKPHDEQGVGKPPEQPAARVDLRALPLGEVVESAERFADGLRFAAYRRAGEFPLAMRAAIDERTALLPWQRAMRPIVAGVAVLLFFVLGTTFLLARNLARKGTLETALKERDEQLRNMVHSVKDAILTIDPANRIVLFNRAAERMFAVQAGDVLGREIGTALSACLAPDRLRELLGRLDDGWKSSSASDPPCIVELAGNGQEIPVELSLSTSAVRGEQLLTAIFRDLTERRRVETQLRETNHQLQQLSATLQNYREEERARIARELHDELGQQLTGIRMEVSWLGGRMQPEQGALVDKVASVKEQIDQTIATVRRISSELRPLVLDDLGFGAAAAWYVEQFRGRTGLQVDLALPDADPAPGDAAASALFRILQESLTNVARHAHANRVDVRLALAENAWVLSVADDGVGFAARAENGKDIGLAGMRERARNLGGRLAVTSAPGRGTTVEAVIPVNTLCEGQSWKN